MKVQIFFGAPNLRFSIKYSAIIVVLLIINFFQTPVWGIGRINMKDYKLFSVRVGYSNSILVANGSNSILVDTGVKGPLQPFKILFRQFNVHPTDIKLIVLTHTHYDHTGNLKALAEFTGAKVIVHKNEYNNLKNGFIPIPDGNSPTTRFISKLGKLFYPKYASPKAFQADLVNEDEFDLNEFGVNGKIISTPGHTMGSQSVLLANTLISGDTFINIRNGIIFPHFADHPRLLLETWQQLFDLGIEVIYPGHGPKFGVEKARQELEIWKRRLEQQ